MRTVTCKELGSVTAISIGTTYNIIDESGSRYTIINDKGVQANYGKNLFNAPVEVREEPVAQAPAVRRGRPARVQPPVAVAAPVPAPIRVVDQIEVETSASINDGNISFSTSFNFGGGLVTSKEAVRIIEARGVNASCGIQSISGINALNAHIEGARAIFDRYVNEHTNDFTLSPNLDVEELFTEVTKGLVQDLISVFQGEDSDVEAGLILVSTTTGAIERNVALREALNTASNSVPVPVRNPNSGNDILTWLIPVEA